MDDAFKRLEELVAAPAKKKRYDRPMTPEQKARKAECDRKRRAESPDRERERGRECYRRWRAKGPESQEKVRENDRKRSERKTADPELFAVNQAEKYARNGTVARDITANCPEPTRSKLQALVDQIKQDPSAGKQVVGLLCNMRELRKLELAEQQQATETETEN